MSARRLIPLASLALPLLALAACETPSPAQRRLLDSFIGHPQVDLVRAFGVPSRTYSTDGHTFLAYIDNQTGYDPAFGPGFGYGGFGYGGIGYGGFGYGRFGYGGYGGYGGFGGYGGGYYSFVCTTTFEITGDRVASWTLRGDGC